MDLAFKVQKELEEALFHIVGLAVRQTGIRKVCLAGGVALNSVANYKLLTQLGLEDIFIFPAAGDSGIAAGCALWAYATEGQGTQRHPFKTANLGRPYSSDEIRQALEKFSHGLDIHECTSAQIIEHSARAMAKGHIIARFAGGSEYGPRALGYRSILADPHFSKMKDIINARVKFREAFRPFAPVVPEEKVGDIFEHTHPSPFMLLISPIKPEYQAHIPGVSHHDGTGRLQTTTRETHPFLYQLCWAITTIRGGLPVLLNTSFNMAGQPIVETPEEAIEMFLQTDIDYLCLENLWITKRDCPVKAYEDHLATVKKNPHPQGLAPEQPPVTDLMKKLDRALFFGDMD